MSGGGVRRNRLHRWRGV